MNDNTRKVMFSSERDDWRTPKELFEQLDNEFHFTIDVASSDENALCEKHYTKKDDALSKNWGGLHFVIHHTEEKSRNGCARQVKNHAKMVRLLLC